MKFCFCQYRVFRIRRCYKNVEYFLPLASTVMLIVYRNSVNTELQPIIQKGQNQVKPKLLFQKGFQRHCKFNLLTISEEPIEVGHLGPDPAERMVPDLVVDIVERRFQKEQIQRFKQLRKNLIKLKSQMQIKQAYKLIINWSN